MADLVDLSLMSSDKKIFKHPFPAKFNLLPNKPWFLCVCTIGFLKTLWLKEKLLVTSNFSFFHSVFYPSGELSVIFIKFEISCLQTLSVWKSLKFVVWGRVKLLTMIHISIGQLFTTQSQLSARYSFYKTL